MSPDVRVYLRDIVTCCEAIAEYTAGRTLDDYLRTRMMRMAIERELITIGEAVNQASRLEPSLVGALTDARRIVDFRNLAVHAYAKLQPERVWEIATVHVPKLLREAKAELTLRDEGGSA